MKTQMRFQKIFMLVSLIIAALCIVYALAFCSGMLFQVTELFDKENGEYSVRATIDGKRVVIVAEGAMKIFEVSQNVSSVLLILGIVMVLCVVLNYIAATNKRRKYYITNYIAIGVVVAYAVALAVIIIVMVLNCQSVIAATNLENLEIVYNARHSNDSFNADNVWMFPVGYALAALLLATAVGYILNLVWKVKLMQGEKKLLANGFVKEVA